jgi:hypothetical protein
MSPFSARPRSVAATRTGPPALDYPPGPLAGAVVPLMMSLDAPVDEELILRMLDHDLLDKVLTYIADDTRLPVWLACKGFCARRPTGEQTMKTSVRAMYATPAMFAWAMDNGCPPPQSLDRNTADALFHAIFHLEPASRAPWVGALFQGMKHPSHRFSDLAYTRVSDIDSQSLAPYASAIAGFLRDTDFWVRDKAMFTLGRLQPAVITRHASAIAQLLDDLPDKRDDENFVYCALHALYMMKPDARAPYVGTIARTIARGGYSYWEARFVREERKVRG